jgi:hypothetical protein
VVLRKEVKENMINPEESMGKWVWCLHCERIFKYDGGMECAYKDCEGGIIDFMEWEEFRESVKSGGIDTPEEPEAGVVYSLYAKKT